MAHGGLVATLGVSIFVWQVIAFRTEVESHDGPEDYKQFQFDPPSIEEIRNLEGWDDAWGPDFQNGVLAPMSTKDNSFRAAGMDSLNRNSGKGWHPDYDATKLGDLEPFDMELDPNDEEDMEGLRKDLCEPKEINQEFEEEDSDEEEAPVLDHPKGPKGTAQTECGLLYPRLNFGQTPKSEAVMACKLVPQNADQTAEDLLMEAKVGSFPDGWWQNDYLQGDWKRWFIAGYAPLKDLEGILFDASSGDMVLWSSVFVLPIPTLYTNSGINPYKRAAYVKNAPPEKMVKGPITVQTIASEPAQPTTHLSFEKYLVQGKEREVEYRGLYQPRRGSLRHAAKMNQKEDIVLIFTMPLTLWDLQATPYIDNGWRDLQPEGVRESADVLKNLVRPLFKSNCNYFPDIAGKAITHDWFYDFTEPRRHAHDLAFGEDGKQVPAADVLQAFDEQTCPCQLAPCKYANFFEEKCPVKEQSKQSMKTALKAELEGKITPKKNWATELVGIWEDVRDKFKGCKHIIKKTRTGYKFSFRYGVNGNKKDRSCSPSSKKIETIHKVLKDTPDPNVFLYERKTDMWVHYKIVSILTPKPGTKKRIRSYWIRDLDEEGSPKAMTRTWKGGR